MDVKCLVVGWFQLGSYQLVVQGGVSEGNESWGWEAIC